MLSKISLNWYMVKELKELIKAIDGLPNYAKFSTIF
jgi:hypothetical protein